MTYAKLCQRHAADVKRYRAMSELVRRSFYGRFIFRRIRKTHEKLKAIEKAIGVHYTPTGNYQGPNINPN